MGKHEDAKRELGEACTGFLGPRIPILEGENDPSAIEGLSFKDKVSLCSLG